MAKMKDPKPVRPGEAKTWQCFADGLPKNYIVYFNRSVYTWEFDFCILAPKQGLFIVEVKGWSPDYVVNVLNSNQINLKGEEEPVGSPRSQARAYCFDLVKLLKNKYGFNPLVLDMVCYPEISKEDYYRKRLDVVSDDYETIFKEELEDPQMLLDKLNKRFYQGDKIHHDFMDEKLYARIRHYFEPDYDLKEDIEILNPGYSRLRIVPDLLADEDINAVVEEYFSGIKQVLFLSDNIGYEKTVTLIESKYKKKNLRYEKGSLVIGAKEFSLDQLGDHYTNFNFDAYLVKNLNTFTDKNVLIEEGITSIDQQKILDQLANITFFNHQQYQLEHAPTDKNIKVTAGAGTGKTYSMVSRVAYLCNKTIDPVISLSDDILMITFTNEAAENMKTRLKQMFMNYFLLTANEKYLHYIEDLSETQISTIHKFAISLLRKTCFYLGLGKEFDIRSEVFERRQIYSRLVNEYLENKITLDSTFQKKLRVPTYELTDILMKFADQLYNKSVDVKKLSDDDIRGVDQQFLYFSEMIDQIVIPAEKEYFDLLIQNNSIDLRQCMILLQEQVDKHVIRKKDFGFHYVFVDEFQDTDDYQIESLHGLYKLLPDYCRLFIVGDLKQSIYRFRGATLSAFEKIKELCGNWENYYLNINYRSDGRMLAMFDEIFNNMGSTKLLPYNTGSDTLSSRIRKEYDDAELIRKVETHQKNNEEFMDALFKELDNQVEQLNKLKSQTSLSNAEKTIAVLVRYNFQIENIITEGKARNIKIYTTEGGDLYRLQPSMDLYKLVQALSSPTDISALLNLINSNYVSMRLEYAGLGGLSQEEKLNEVLNVLDEYFMRCMERNWGDLVKELYSRPILIVLRDIYENTQPWRRYASEDGKLFYRQNYECLLEEIVQRYSRDYLTLNMINNLLAINITTYQDRPSRDLEAEQTDEIKIVCMTVHKSKGLEFGTVVLPYTSEQIDRLKENRSIVNYDNDHLAFSVALGDIQICNSYFNPQWESMEVAKDEARILYVAMTRAIRNFVWFSDMDTVGSLTWKSLLEVNKA